MHSSKEACITRGDVAKVKNLKIPTFRGPEEEETSEKIEYENKSHERRPVS